MIKISLKWIINHGNRLKKNQFRVEKSKEENKKSMCNGWSLEVMGNKPKESKSRIISTKRPLNACSF